MTQPRNRLAQTNLQRFDNKEEPFSHFQRALLAERVLGSGILVVSLGLHLAQHAWFSSCIFNTLVFSSIYWLDGRHSLHPIQHPLYYVTLWGLMLGISERWTVHIGFMSFMTFRGRLPEEVLGRPFWVDPLEAFLWDAIWGMGDVMAWWILDIEVELYDSREDMTSLRSEY